MWKKGSFYEAQYSVRWTFLLQIWQPPTPRNDNHVEPYTFVTLIWADPYTPTPIVLRNTWMASYRS